MIELYIPKFLDILYEDNIRDNLTFNEVRDAFHSNQIISKNDAIHGFGKLPDAPKNILHLGSWFGFLTRYLCESYPQHTISEIDVGSRFDIISKRFNAGLDNFKDRFIVELDTFENYNQYTTVINLSIECMSDECFSKIPIGTECVFQSTDFKTKNNINSCSSIQDMKQKYNLSTVFYENTLNLNVYNRFTLVGIK